MPDEFSDNPDGETRKDDNDIDYDTNNYPDRYEDEDLLSKKSYRQGKYGKIFKEDNQLIEDDICTDCGKPIETEEASAEDEWFDRS